MSIAIYTSIPAFADIAYREKFLSRFVKKIRVESNGCWTWLGGTFGSARYGGISIRHKFYTVHKASYIFFNGNIPEGTELRHSCDNTLCANPGHILPGSHQQNMQDRSIRKRTNCVVLSEADVKYIRSHDLPTAIFQQLFSCSRFAVEAVKKKITWRHV